MVCDPGCSAELAYFLEKCSYKKCIVWINSRGVKWSQRFQNIDWLNTFEYIHACKWKEVGRRTYSHEENPLSTVTYQSGHVVLGEKGLWPFEYASESHVLEAFLCAGLSLSETKFKNDYSAW